MPKLLQFFRFTTAVDIMIDKKIEVTFIKHGAILYNETEVFSLSITIPTDGQCSYLIGLFTQV